MNAITKRLLSFVIVLAMVLSMAPAITLPAAAATTDDIDSWIEAFEAAEAAGDVSTITTCPFCSGTEVTWTAKSGAVNGNQEANKFSGHYYLSDGYSASGNSRAIWLAGNSCCYLNGYSVSNTTDATSYSVIATSGYTLNIFGDGTITNNGTGKMFDFNAAGRVNIYGGTWTHNLTGGSVMVEDQTFSGSTNTTHVLIYGGTFNVNMDTYDEDNSCTYDNVQIAEGYEVTDNGNGTWTVAAPEAFVPPETCPCCGVAGDQLTWRAIDGTEGGQITNNSTNWPETHFYLAKDITLTGVTYLFYRSAASSCLYLNGKNLTYGGSSAVFHAAGQTMTIFGEGTVTSTSTTQMFNYNGAGAFVIYGGTYKQDGTKLMFGDNSTPTHILGTHAMIYGGTFDMDPSALSFTYENTAVVADGYSVTDNGNGTYTVGLKTSVCPGCGETIADSAWEEYTDQHLTEETALTEGTKHYKLTADLTCGPYGLYMTGGTVCFDLNGHNINRSGTGAAFRMTAGTLNVVGEGVVTGSQYGTVRLDSAAATANLKGGTYTKYTTASGGYRSASILSLESGGTVNMYDGVTLTTAGKYNNGYGAAVALGGKSDTAKSIFNMYGGTITFGDDVQNIQSAGTLGGLITVGRSVLSCWAEANISGGTITAVAVENVLGDAIYVSPDENCSLTISGDVVINGEVWAGIDDDETVSSAIINLSGTPTISNGLVLNGTQVNIDALEADASIDVTAALGDVLTAASENAAAVIGCFTLTGETELVIKNVDNQLVVAANINLPAICPGCGLEVAAEDWTAISEATTPASTTHSAFYLAGSSAVKAHCYLAQDVTIASDATYGFLQAYATECCLFLNGKTLTNNGTKGVFLPRANTLNIYGEGKVINNSDTLMFDFNGTGRVNIQGGEYVQNSTTVGMFEDLVVTAPQTTHALISGGTFNVDLATLKFTNNTASKTVTLEGVSVVNGNSETVYADGAAALAAYEGGYIRANEDAALEITGATYIDAAGNAVTVTGSGTLYAMDNSGDDYTTGGKFMIADTVQVVRDVTGGANGYRYISLNHGSVADSDLKYLKAHRLDMKLKTVSLRPAIEDNAGQMGLYYKAQISCGADLGSALGTEDNCYGVVVSLQDMPGADFATEINPENNKNRNGFTEIKGGLSVSEENSWTVTLNSGSVFGIMTASEAVLADESLQTANATYGKMPIYANAYLYIDFDGEGDYDADEFIMGDTANGGKNTETMDSNGVAWSLYDVLYTIDTKWTNFEAAHESINKFYTYWYPYGMNAWSFTKITKNS